MSEIQETGVMVFGGLIAVAGIALLFYAESPGSNRVKAFGVEFELSTPALVVFLAGCALVIAPSFLPADPSGDANFIADESAAGVSDGTSDPAGGNSGSAASMDSSDGEQASLGDAVTVTCENGIEVALKVGTPLVDGQVIRVPVQLRNLSEDEQLAINQYVGIVVTEPSGQQLDYLPFDDDWDPPDIDAGAFYEGIVVARSSADSLPNSVVVRIPEDVFYGRCPRMAAKVSL